MPPKYPLHLLLEQRDRELDAAKAELAEVMREREAAERARAKAAQNREEAVARGAATKQAEADLLAGGALRVADLARGEVWARALDGEMAALTAAVEEQTKRVAAAEQLEHAARERLAQRKAARDVVARDRARFEERSRRVAEASEQEAAEEAFIAGRRER